MTKASEIIRANAKYMTEGDIVAIECLDDNQVDAALAALDEMTGGSDLGIDCSVVKTNETLADFDAARAGHWSEKGARKDAEFKGFKALAFSRFQLFKGAPRQRALIVIDMGDFRIALS